jgi:hypothetical protein
VLNGRYKGMVVNLDRDRHKPQFTFERNFLDWYERWLDEVISGELIKDGPSWFGYTKGGSEEDLLDSYLSATDSGEKKDSLLGLLNKTNLKEQTLNEIDNLIKKELELKNTMIEILCKSDYERAKPHLVELVKTDMLSTFQFIYWYAKNKSEEWVAIIEATINRIDDSETFRFCTYLLKEANLNYSNLILPFTKNNKEDIRGQAFYTLGSVKNKKDLIDVFIEGLKDDSNRVVLITLQALSGVKDPRLLEEYKRIAEKFTIDQDYILSNLNNRLAEFGFTSQTILDKNFRL